MHMLLANKLGALAVLAGDLARDATGDLSGSAAAVLFTLHHHGPATATGLAAVLGIAQPTAVRVIGGLVGQGLVEPAGRDGRSAPFRLTASGARTARSLQSARLASLQRLLDPLDPGERAMLEAMLDRMLAAATTSRRFARTTCRLCDHAVCDGPDCPIGCRATEVERSQSDDEGICRPC